jgi:nucleotidyltransferase substrate binding protein (TIGR01987 family)
MEKLTLRLAASERALATLEAVLNEPFSVIVRDAAIQRFEYTFESVWKLVKQYLYEIEGIVCNSPKGCWRELLAVGMANETEVVTLLAMTDDRNLTSHTYVEALAKAIYQKLPVYTQLLRTVQDRVAALLPADAV